jgi:hypothetical protein
MRDFANGHFALRRAPRPLRLVYAAFLVLLMPGFLTQLGVQLARIGVTPAAIADYYRGSDRGDVMTFAKNVGQLLELTHAHAFMMAVVFLILAHLFLGTSVSATMKAVVLTAAFAGTLGDLAGAWMVRYVSGACAWVVVGAWVAQLASYLTMIAVGLRDCLATR